MTSGCLRLEEMFAPIGKEDEIVIVLYSIRVKIGEGKKLVVLLPVYHGIIIRGTWNIPIVVMDQKMCPRLLP